MYALGVGQSDRGKLRGVNEDAYLVDNDAGLYIVCDGMGGHAAGEVASHTACQVVSRHVQSRKDVIDRIRRGTEPHTRAVEIGRASCRERV